MALNTAALLAQVEQAIEQLLTGNVQSYSIGSRSVTKLDLSKLFEERRLLQAEVAREQRGGSQFTLGRMGRPR